MTLISSTTFSFFQGIIVEKTSWVWIFYGSAILTFIWAGAWAIFFYDMPEDDPFISGENWRSCSHDLLCFLRDHKAKPLQQTVSSSDSERKLILTERSYDPSQREKDQKTPLLPLVCDITKTPAVWFVEIDSQAKLSEETFYNTEHKNHWYAWKSPNC